MRIIETACHIPEMLSSIPSRLQRTRHVGAFARWPKLVI